MMRRSPRILIIEPFQDIRLSLSGILEDNGYLVDAVDNPDDGLKLILARQYAIIICCNQLQETSGMQFYRSFKSHLQETGTAFFLLLEESEREGILTGLELGIDNFILLPLKKDRLINKIINQISKTEEFDDLRTEKFLDYFNSSPIAMFIIKQNRIIKVNRSFESLIGLKHEDLINSDFYDLLNIAGEQNNISKYYKLKKGVIHNCSLENLQFPGSDFSGFGTLLYKSNSDEEGKILGEIIPLFNLNDKKDQFEVDKEKIHELVTENVFVLGNRLSNLTDREFEIYKLSAIGLPIKQIASRLNLSMRTVEKHRSNIMRKTNAHNMIEAIRYIQSLNSDLKEFN